MADAPEGIVLKRHRDLDSPGFVRPVRWLALSVLAAFLVLGLANCFGQHPGTTTVTSERASLELYAPSHLRGGLLYEARFTITAHEDLDHVVLQLEPGWLESHQINTIEPGPVSETSRNGSLALTLGSVKKDDHFTLYLEGQVNPTNIGRRNADVVLYEGSERLLTLDHTITIFP